MIFACFLPYFREEVLLRIYFAFFLYFDNFKQLLFSQIPAMHTLMLCEDIGREMKF